MILGRFILRFLVVPLGASVALLVAMAVLVVAYRHAFLALAQAPPDQQENDVAALLMAGPALFAVLSYSALMMMLPAAVGVLVAETFALRSWIYHALNGGIAAWAGWSAIGSIREQDQFLTSPTVIVGAGLAAGFAYWLVAGWSAGFWKPVFAPRAAPGLAPEP